MIHRRFHRWMKCLKERFSSLGLYVSSNVSILFCFIYVLNNFLILSILRNNLMVVVISLCSFILFLFYILLRYKSRKEKLYETYVSGRVTIEKGSPLSQNYTQILVIMLAMILSSARLLVFVSSEQSMLKAMESFTDKYNCFDVKIVNEPDEEDGSIKYYGNILSVNSDKNKNISKILFKYPSYLKFKPGDLVTICGTLTEPEVFQDFDYKKFLMNKNVYGILKVSSIKKTGREISFKTLLFDLKQILIEKIEKRVTEPQTSLLAGILFGENRVFSEDFEENLRKAGTSHIVAASGYNVTILVILTGKMFKFIKKKWRNILSILFIWCFCILSGGSASIVRATIMGSLVLVANTLGRYQSINRTLFIGIWLFVFVSPAVIYDVGFLLSILATLGLIYFSSSFESFIEKRIKLGEFFKEYLLSTISCTLFTLPVSISVFGTFSVVGIFANALVLPVLESTMLWGFLGLLSAFFSNIVSRVFLSVCFVQLKYFEYIVSIFGSLPFSSFEVSGMLKYILSISLILVLSLFVITEYPIENESFNYYFRLNRDEDI